VKNLISQRAEHRPMREFTYVNCWHENQHESDAMWNLYSKDISNAIAIRTTYERLYYAINRNPSIQIGRINYIDFKETYSSTNSAHWYKRVSFSHENEVRAVMIDFKNQGSDGILIPADLSKLIECVYISPKADKWFVNIVKDVNAKYGINASIEHSELSKKPFYY
ncbi:MAG TPA: hypothetical protein VNZ45_11490, partial [Bacteroidia bacterium]|nr:hypothetical protein [Bacteroidia bacterium]